MNKSEEALQATQISSPPTPTDDESISTSTASDTFETWTLVTDKNKEKAIATEAVELNDNTDRLEILKQRKAEENSEASEADEEEEEQIEPKPYHDSTADDLSDGISIISESESAGGRISPHPYLLEHLNNLNLKYSTGDDFVGDRPRLATPPNTSAESVAEDNSLRQRRRKRSTSTNTERKALQTADARVGTALAVMPIPPIVRRGLAGIFYVGVALAILAFIGKLRYPEWEPLGAASKPMAELEQKLSDIELQNNLMRAEIDLLSKQVNYLSNNRGSAKAEASQPVPSTPYHHHQHTPQQERKGKTFKAWSGNGNSMDAVDITKGDLKRAHKCPDGKFVEIAGMCVENKDDIEPLMDQFGNAVNDMLQQSETFKLFEKMAEEYHASSENPFETAKEDLKVAKGEVKREAQVNEQWKDQQRHDRREEKSRNGWTEKRINRRREHKNSAESDENHSANSKERKYEKRHNNNNNNKGEYNSSEERLNKPRTTNDSKERYSAKHEQKARRRSDSNEHRKPDKSTSSEELYHKDGQWQEQLSKHREDARRQNERQRNNKNWYIERGSSREQMRHGDLAYR